MVSDLVQRVVGDHAVVAPLMGPGVDPHLYKPTRNDMRRLLDADLVIYNGLHLEGRMQETFTQLQRSGKRVAAVSDGLDRMQLRTPPEFSGNYDPHVWMDVALWSECVQHVAGVLSDVDPAHAAEFRQRADRYCAELQELDAYVQRVTASIPESQRVLVTAHDAFGYFARRYGLEVRSIQGVTTESEAGVGDVNALVDFLVARQLPAIFVETSVSQKQVTAVLEGARARGAHVRIGGELFSDALGAADTYEGTYVGMIDSNATHIAAALGGDAPERGLRGRLSAPAVAVKAATASESGVR